MSALSQMKRLEGGRYQDESGVILPWYTTPCLEWLLTLDLKGKRVFEYGAGDSTKWYTSKGAVVYAVDHDMHWAEFCNVLHETEKEEYIAAIYCDDWQDYDIIVIDGLYRDECTEDALKRLKPGGYLILDNWKQPSVEPEWPTTEKLIEGMEQRLFVEPGHYDPWQTLVVRKPI